MMERDADDRPDAAAFERPPFSFVDEEGRSIEIRMDDEANMEALVGMYERIETEDRTQGLPPATTDGIRSWLDEIRPDGIHLVAWHGDSAVGHACLVPAGDRGHELAIFVRSSYHHARIGTTLLRALLGQGAASGVDRVWLTVRRDNVVARNLYRSTGFERADERTAALATDVTMARPL